MSNSTSTLIWKHIRAGSIHLVLILPLLILVLTRAPVAAQTEGPNQAGLVIAHGDGTVVTRCVAFAEDQITGLELMRRSGLQWQSANGPMGSAICNLNGEGCSASDCFCQCKKAPCAYWNYFNSSGDGLWTYAGQGAAARTLHNGDVDGWIWGDGASPPPSIALDAICTAGDPGIPEPQFTPTVILSLPANTSTPTALPTATVTLTGTPTPRPTVVQVREPSRTPLPEVTASPQPVTVIAPTVVPSSTSDPFPIPTATPPGTHTPDDLPMDKGDFTTTPTIPSQLGAFALVLGVIAVLYLVQKRMR
ncbi:MAG: hypothetical protein P1S60_01000 [Anaerolineae bacterium]|nr:hypothetical protein [Anaerolineae bacterium]